MHLLQLLNAETLIQTAGYLGLFAIVFAESGLFFGFFFPGDSLLFTAGLLAATSTLNIWWLLLLLPLAAVLGDSTGYWFGTWIGPRLFTQEHSFFFNKKYVTRAHEFYQHYGPRAIILARFMPVVRTFVPIVAGVGRMPYRTFLTFNIIGGVGWSAGVTLLGYFLGRTFPAVQHYLTYVILLIIVVSLLPIARELLAKR
jgi:membrane-associated protein